MFWEAFVFLSKTLNKTDTTSIQKRAFIIYTQKTSKIDKNYPLPLHDVKTMLHELKPQTPIKPHNRLPIYLTSNSNKYPRYNTTTKEKLIKGNPQINYLLLAKDGIEKCFMNLFFLFLSFEYLPGHGLQVLRRNLHKHHRQLCHESPLSMLLQTKGGEIAGDPSPQSSSSATPSQDSISLSTFLRSFLSSRRILGLLPGFLSSERVGDT